MYPDRSERARHWLPVGRYRGRAVTDPDVPTDYLDWYVSSCSPSRGLRHAIEAELARRRGLSSTTPPPLRPLPACKRCVEVEPGAEVSFGWHQVADGTRRIRASCGGCGGFLAFAPIVEPYISEADAAASETAALDVLTAFEDLEIELHSDGRTCWPAPGHRDRVPIALLARLRECGHQLAGLLGRRQQPLTGLRPAAGPERPVTNHRPSRRRLP